MRAAVHRPLYSSQIPIDRLKRNRVGARLAVPIICQLFNLTSLTKAQNAVPIFFQLRTNVRLTGARQAVPLRVFSNLLPHRNLNFVMLRREVDCFVVARIDMAHHSGAGIIGQHAFEAFGHVVGAVRNYHLA